MTNKLEELKAIAVSIGDSSFTDDDIPESLGVTLYEQGMWTDEGKYSYCEDIYTDAEGNYYSVVNSRSGSYYSDYYYSGATVTLVKPKEITTTIWEQVVL